MSHRFKVLIATGALVGAMVVPASPADAAVSVGESQLCRTPRSTGALEVPRCVVATGKAVSGGTSVTGGHVVAACEGVASGASIVEVTCTAKDENGVEHSNTRSLTGTAAAAELTFPTTSIDPVTVCWSATGYWPNPGGGVTAVSTSGCGVTV